MACHDRDLLDFFGSKITNVSDRKQWLQASLITNKNLLKCNTFETKILEHKLSENTVDQNLGLNWV